jgi:hypothetical protein
MSVLFRDPRRFNLKTAVENETFRIDPLIPAFSRREKKFIPSPSGRGLGEGI